MDGSSIYVPLRGRQLTREAVLSQVFSAAAEQGMTDTAALLVLDEADRVPDSALVAALRDLLSRFVSARVVVMLRRLSSVITRAAPTLAPCAMLPNSPEHMLWNYAEPAAERLLEVRAFGPGRVQVDGRDVTNWDGYLPRSLFFYFVDRGMVTRKEIFDTFWPGLSSKEATNVFHVTKRKVNELMGADITEFESGFYRIAPQVTVQYDVTLFEENLRAAAATTDAVHAFVLYERAVVLYRGEFLSSTHMEWIQRRAAHLRGLVVDALMHMARLSELRGDLARALSSLLRAFGLMPFREDIAMQAMQMSVRQGYRDQAERIFQTLNSALLRRQLVPNEQVLAVARSLALLI
jgi:DNA-binding SARP family transcriptional activator